MPADMLLSENARARGFRLDGYGVFFDVEVPSLEGTLPWSFRTLDQNDLGVDNALRTLRSFVEASAANDVNLQQALKRIELQVTPVGGGPLSTAVPVAGGASADVVTTSTATPSTAMGGDPIVNTRRGVSARCAPPWWTRCSGTRGLGIGPAVAHCCRAGTRRPRLAPADRGRRIWSASAVRIWPRFRGNLPQEVSSGWTRVF
jgi:hypothetical protein